MMVYHVFSFGVKVKYSLYATPFFVFPYLSQIIGVLFRKYALPLILSISSDHRYPCRAQVSY